MCFNDRNFVQQPIELTPEGKPGDTRVEILRVIEQLHATVQARNFQTLAYLLDMARLEAIRLTQPDEHNESEPSKAPTQRAKAG